MKIALKLALILGVLFLSSLSVFYFYKINTRNAVLEAVKERKIINILVAGNKNYDRHRHTFFAVISFNPENNNIGVLFIPPKFKLLWDKEKNIFKRIEDISLKEFDKLKLVLQEKLELNLSFYLELYSEDLKRVIDLLEGLEIFFLNKDQNYFFDLGINYLDGEKILKYIETDSIFTTYDRIQDILLTLYQKRNQKKFLAELDFISFLISDFNSNLLPNEILSLLDLILNQGNLFFFTLPGEFDKENYFMDEIALNEYQENFRNRIIMSDKAIPKIKVKILNGTSIPKLARKMRSNLIKEGISIVEFGTFHEFKFSKSTIFCQKGDYNLARKISDITGINKIYFKINNNIFSDCLIIVGKDFVGDF